MNQLGGEVSSIKFFTGKYGAIDENGLLSESIFGPVHDFKCKCNKLSLESCDGGKTCDRCGVLCGPSDLRLRTFGKISLVFPVIKSTKRKYFKKIVGTNHKHILDPRKADALAITSRYLIVSFAADELKVVDNFTPISGYFTVPIRITGLYSFILSLKYVAEILDLPIAQQLFTDQYIIDVVKVLPPDIRPVVKDPKTKGEFRYVEINKHYISLINQNNLNISSKDIARQKEKDWFDKLRYNLENDIIDELVDPIIPEYDRATARYQYYVDLIYNSVYEGISGKTGFIRGSILGKTIEFSGRSVIIIDPSLEAYKVKVSRKILYKLWFPYFLYYLSKYKEEDYTILFDNYTQFEDYDLYKDVFAEFLSWFCADRADKIAEIENDDDTTSTVKSLIKRRKIEIEDEEDQFD
jgi:DNA-directed RNA polymerase beta' subunit